MAGEAATAQALKLAEAPARRPAAPPDRASIAGRQSSRHSSAAPTSPARALALIVGDDELARGVVALKPLRQERVRASAR